MRLGKEKYYSLNKILEYNATYNVIFGERSNGKTYSVLIYAIKRFLTEGTQLAIIRRWAEDIKGRRASEIFSGVIANNEIYKLSKGRYSGIRYWAGKFYLCNYDDEGKAICNDNDIFAYIFSISEGEHNKSISYPRVGTILFDEFITNKIYLPDEFVLFMNVLSTIIRDREDVKIFMLGNTVNRHCPYFKEMGLRNASTMEQGTIDLYKYGNSNLTVAVEYCKSNKKSKNNNHIFAFDNPKLEMITGGAWELGIYPHLPVKYRPKDVLLTYFIEFDNEWFQGNIIEDSATGDLFTYIHRKTSELQDVDNDIVYSLRDSHRFNWSKNILKARHKAGSKIAWFFLADKVFYQDNEVGDIINNYLKICKRGVM